MAGCDLAEEALADPANDGDRLAVPDRLVTRAVRTFTGWLAAPRDLREVAIIAGWRDSLKCGIGVRPGMEPDQGDRNGVSG